MALQDVTLPVKPIVMVHFVVNCVLIVITLGVVGLRIVSRSITSAGLGWDDYLILAAMPEAIGMLVIQGLYLPLGVGHSMSEALPNIAIILKLTVAYSLVYSICIATVKLSVLCFYLRIFVNKYLRIATKVVFGFVCAWTVANILMLFLLCRPFRANFDPVLAIGHCGDQVKAYMSIGIFNILSDVMICLLPIPTIWGLQAHRKMKISLTGLFVISLAVSAVAACRIAALAHVEIANFTRTMVWVDFLSTTEVSLGILFVSLPMLGPVLNRIRKRNASGYSSRSWQNQYPNAATKGSMSKFSSKKKQPGVDTIILNSIDGGDDHVYPSNAETSSQAGSEASLNPASSRRAQIGTARV